MFETFLVVDEFEFLQIGSKETHWVRNNNLGFADLDCCFVGVELRVPHQLLQREQAHSQTLHTNISIFVWIQRLTYFGLLVNSYSRNSGMYLRFGCIWANFLGLK